jgi:hypothetical protein
LVEKEEFHQFCLTTLYRYCLKHYKLKIEIKSLEKDLHLHVFACILLFALYTYFRQHLTGHLVEIEGSIKQKIREIFIYKQIKCS